MSTHFKNGVVYLVIGYYYDAVKLDKVYQNIGPAKRRAGTLNKTKSFYSWEVEELSFIGEMAVRI